MTQFVTLRVARGSQDGAMTMQEFQVPYVEGMSVLDGLIWVRGHLDPTLAVRYSCINANACKECSMMVDGEVAYACTARLASQGVTVAPLEGKTVIRDLVTDIAPAKEHLTAALKPGR
jgi:succinate dehydrogenase/fumarate reductase-like Fe-S protein